MINNFKNISIIKILFIIVGFSALFSIFPISTFASNTWTTITPPNTSGYTFNTLKVMDSYVFVGTNQGVYKSSDAGSTWSVMNSGLSNTNVTTIAIGWIYDGTAYVSDSSTPVIIGTSAGIFYSTTGGSSWTSASTGPTGAVNDIEFDQFEAISSTVSHVYAAGTLGVYRSDDSGINWTLKNTGIGSNKNISEIVTDLAGGLIYALSSTGEVYSSALKSVSGSDESWTLVKSADANASDISILNPRGGVTWIARINGVLKSDGATTWSDVSGGLSSIAVRSVESDYTDSNITYAATANGIYRTTNEALSSPEWLSIQLGLSDLNIRQIKTNPANSLTVYALGLGIYKIDLSDAYVDLTVPSTISDLALTTVDSSTLRLNWTAPGNDGVYGTASSYEVRYSASGTITDVNWDTVSSVSGPFPSAPGTVETMNFTKPDSGSTYYFAIKALDGAGNKSIISNVASAAGSGDTTAPVISSVASSTTSTTATITWTTDEASSSQIDYGTSTSYTNSTTVDETLVTSHSVVISGLTTSTYYHFRVRSYDASNNGSVTGDYTFTTTATIVKPTVVTNNASGIATTTATLNGSITVTGGADATQSGFAYGTNPSLSTVIATSTLGAQVGAASFYSYNATSLACGTTYFFRAFATNSAGVGFGSINSLSTSPCSTVPVVTTQSASSLTATTATLNGNITATGFVIPTVRGFVYGLTTAYGATTTANGSFSTGAYSASISSLVCNTLYHVKGYATNSIGAGYGNDSTFTTGACPDTTAPVVSSIASTTSATTATITWTTNESSNSQVNYGATISYGASTTLDSSLVTSHTVTVTGLSANTIYNYRVRSSDANGNLATSTNKTFKTTVATVPTVTISSVSVSQTTATLNGNITATNGATPTVRGFVYGLTTTYSATTTESGSFSTGAYTTVTDISGLTCATTYHFSSYATNSVGTAYGADSTFTTSACTVVVVVTPPSSSGGGGGSRSGGGGGGGAGAGVYVNPLFATNKTTALIPTTPIATGGVVSSSFSRSLTVGSSGEDVRSLQKFLNAKGFKIALTGPGSPGNETTLFGGGTMAALAKFQASNGLPSTGYFGPMTISKVKALGGTVSSVSSGGGSLFMKQFVELLIAIGAIAPTKIQAARQFLLGLQ